MKFYILYVLIQYLSLSKPLGTLVLILFAMIKDVTQFAVIFFFCIFGFGITFFGTFSFLQEFKTPGDAFVSMFSAALGNFDVSIFQFNKSIESGYSIFGIIIYMIFVCFVTLILCNILLAQMACTYQAISDVSYVEWRFVKVITIFLYNLISLYFHLFIYLFALFLRYFMINS